jgi:AcrR family transcriptional regulator
VYPETLGSAKPPRTPQEARRDAILRAALHAFNRHGFGATSIDMVAAEVGVTRQTIYRHFRDKEELLFQALQRAQSFNDARAQIPAGCHIVDEEVLLRRALFHGHATEAGPMRTYALLTSLSPAHRNELMSNLEDVMSLDLGRIQVGLDQGFYRRVDLYIAERVRSGLYSWFPIWFDPQGPNTPVEIADNHTALFLYGLKPRLQPERFGQGPA